MAEIIQIKDGSTNALPIGGESGSGYCKMADGTLMCWGRADVAIPSSSWTSWGSLYIGSIAISQNFPVSFVAQPSVSAVIDSQDGVWAAVISVRATTTSMQSLSLTRPNVLADTAKLSWTAIGRWK